MKISLRAAHIDTPTGAMLCVTNDQEQLRLLAWDDHRDRLDRLLRRHAGGVVTVGMADAPASVAAALTRYFAGELSALDALEVDPGGTAFQRECWMALRRIPPGETRSYSQQASVIGRPSATRAVGLANAANPIAIVVPCHRVIGADGSLTGFGGGIARKRWLLAHERAGIAAVQPELFGAACPQATSRL